MQARNKQALRRRVTRPFTVAVAAAAASCCAWADEPNPYYIGVTQSFTHDTNVYSTPGGPGDNYSSTGLTGGFDQAIGRQHVYAHATVRYNKYRSETALDNTSYGVAAGWDWATIEQLSGSLTATANQGLATTGGNGTAPTTERNLVKTDQLGATARWGGAGAFSIDGSYAHSRVSYSSAAYFASQSSGDSASVGAFYRPVPDIRLGTAVRYSRTVSPYGIVVATTPVLEYAPNTSTGRNIDLIGDWSVTPQSGIDARLSWTHQSNSAAGALDFSGLTGALSARYAPTGKLTFRASAGRDAGTNATFFNVPIAASTTTTTTTPTTTTTSVEALSQNSQTTNVYSLNAGYAATAKISVNANATYTRAKLVNTVALSGASTTTEANDNTRYYSLGVDYAVARNWQLGCRAAHSVRTVSGATGYGYWGNSMSCSAQFTLR